MHRRILAGLSLLAVAACAQTAPGVSRVPDQTITVPGSVQQVVVSGEMHTVRIPMGVTTEPRHDLYVRVNGQPAVQGTLVTYGATTLQGAAGVWPVNAACQSREVGRADRQFDCVITVNGQQVPMAFRASPAGPLPPV